MSEGPWGVPWRRAIWEGMTIVFSILLAFAINAWWAGREERARERVLLAGLLADFQATRPDLVARLQMANRMAHNGAALRDLVASSPDGRPVQVPDSLVIAVIGSPTYQPATNTLDAALASGEIELIRNREVRREISSWRLTLDDTFESERDVRAITDDQIVPKLSREVTLGPLLDHTLDWSYARFEPTGQSTLRTSKELAGALGLRVFYQSFAVEGFQELRASLDRMVSLLEAELGK